MYRSHAAVSLLLIVTPCLRAQDPAPPPEPEISAEVRAINAAEGEATSKLLLELMLKRLASGAVFQGQYADLRHADEEALDVLLDWIVTAPDAVAGERAASFRAGCIRVMRDIHDDAAPEDLCALLREAGQDEFEFGEVRREAVYALAQFGDRQFIERELANIEKAIASSSPDLRAKGYNGLARIKHNLRDYAGAAEAFGKLIELNDEGSFTIRPALLPHLLYNRCCALALCDKTEAAFESLERALTLSRKTGRPLTKALLTSDQEIRALRSDPRFARLMKQHLDAVEAAEAAAKKEPAGADKKKG